MGFLEGHVHGVYDFDTWIKRHDLTSLPELSAIHHKLYFSPNGDPVYYLGHNLGSMTALITRFPEILIRDFCQTVIKTFSDLDLKYQQEFGKKQSQSPQKF